MTLTKINQFIRAHTRMTSSQHKIIANTCKAFLLISQLTETMGLLLWQAHVTSEQHDKRVFHKAIEVTGKQAFLLHDHASIESM